ncbi:MAG: enoyl-CoA hydratase/isomerase family protein [Proteobacteria bacterium]|nr:enoyl-CoA hydratase/isomerase family protein [Pseudomonadota bacterium]
MDQGTVRVEYKDRVAILTLDQPDRLNAMDDDMAMNFEAAVEGLENGNQAKVVIVTGAGRAFSAGGNLQNMLSRVGGSPSAYQKNVYRFYKAFLRIMDLDVPTIAAINGSAVGAGACLSLACDMRLAATGAVIGFPFAVIGMHPGMGAEYFLTRLVGRARTFELLMVGESVSAEEAWRMGLVNQVVPGEELMDRAVSLATKIAARPVLPIRMLKESIDTAARSDLEATLRREAAYQGICFMTDDIKEGITSLIEKRRPHFTDEY